MNSNTSFYTMDMSQLKLGDIGKFELKDNSVVDKFDRILDLRDAGRLDVRSYLLSLQDLIQKYPDFIDAYAHISFQYMRDGDYERSLKFALDGYNIGNQLIGDSFDGVVEWGYVCNRPYLRACQGVYLSHMWSNNHNEAVNVMSRVLRLNPNDNQGVRYSIYSEMLRTEDCDINNVISHIEKYAPEHPPYYYELGLIHCINSNWDLAEIALRKALSENHYIANGLLGKKINKKKNMWHGSNLCEPSTAVEYLEMYGELWNENPEAKSFLQWLVANKQVTKEINSLHSIFKKFLSEENFENRFSMLEKIRSIKNHIGSDDSFLLIKGDSDLTKTTPWLNPN